MLCLFLPYGPTGDSSGWIFFVMCFLSISFSLAHWFFVVFPVFFANTIPQCFYRFVFFFDLDGFLVLYRIFANINPCDNSNISKESSKQLFSSRNWLISFCISFAVFPFGRLMFQDHIFICNMNIHGSNLQINNSLHRFSWVLDGIINEVNGNYLDKASHVFSRNLAKFHDHVHP